MSRLGNSRAAGAGARDRQGGFALVIVLWSTALLALLTAHITAPSHGEAQIANGMRNAAMAQAAADGAAREAIFRLLDDSDSRWQADGTRHALRVRSGVAEVRIEDEAGKIDLNAATLPVLARLLRGVGVDEARAGTLAAAIMDWRTIGEAPQPGGAKAPQYAAVGSAYGPPNADFQRIDELSLVLGLTPDLVRRLLPYVTVYGSADVDVTKADPVVAQAIGDPDGAAARRSALAAVAQSRPLIANITAVGSVNRARFGRRAIVVIRGGSSEQPKPYRILSWTRTSD